MCGLSYRDSYYFEDGGGILREYILSSVIISLISAILLHLGHKKLGESVRMAVGVLLLSFVILPLGAVFSSLGELEIPLSLDIAESGVERTAEDAYCDGVKRALSERFGVGKDCFSVSCSGFSAVSLSAEKISVVMSGDASRIDFRAVRDYILESLEAGECECEIKIDKDTLRH